MKLAKPRIDIGFRTNNVAPLLTFWQNEVGLPLEGVLPVRRGAEAAPARPARISAQDQ